MRALGPLHEAPQRIGLMLKSAVPSGVLKLYQREKAEGTELPAIVGLLRDHVEREEERLRTERDERYRRQSEEDRIAREQRLLSGADCQWTQLQKSPCWYCRANGRMYRLTPTKGKMWNLQRVNSISDDEEAGVVGRIGSAVTRRKRLQWWRINLSQGGSVDQPTQCAFALRRSANTSPR